MVGSAGPSAQANPPAPAYQLVVHPNNPLRTLERRYLEDIFLKRIKIWPGGGAIRPVDLPHDSPARHRFTEQVFRRSLAAVRAYWQQRIFSGRDVPPPELESDEEVVRYVLKHPGAIGYVSSAAVLQGAKLVSMK